MFIVTAGEGDGGHLVVPAVGNTEKGEELSKLVTNLCTPLCLSLFKSICDVGVNTDNRFRVATDHNEGT